VRHLEIEDCCHQTIGIKISDDGIVSISLSSTRTGLLLVILNRKDSTLSVSFAVLSHRPTPNEKTTTRSFHPAPSLQSSHLICKSVRGCGFVAFADGALLFAVNPPPNVVNNHRLQSTPFFQARRTGCRC
jgi:hypothetical protein